VQKVDESVKRALSAEHLSVCFGIVHSLEHCCVLLGGVVFMSDGIAAGYERQGQYQGDRYR